MMIVRNQRASRFNGWTENFWFGKEWFMVAMFVITFVLGILSCAAWDGIKAVMRKMR